jgi:hypothetical protein
MVPILASGDEPRAPAIEALPYSAATAPSVDADAGALADRVFDAAARLFVTAAFTLVVEPARFLERPLGMLRE